MIKVSDLSVIKTIPFCTYLYIFYLPRKLSDEILIPYWFYYYPWFLIRRTHG